MVSQSKGTPEIETITMPVTEKLHDRKRLVVLPTETPGLKCLWEPTSPFFHADLYSISHGVLDFGVKVTPASIAQSGEEIRHMIRPHLFGPGSCTEFFIDAV
jgi:hypothetical protein